LKEEIQSSVLLDLKLVELDHLHTLVYELLKQDVNHKFGREKLDSKAVPSCNNCWGSISALEIDVLLAKDADILDEMQLET
jgi:hypothetical protein